MQVSAATGEGLDELKARIAERFEHRLATVDLLVPYSEGGKLAELYALGPPIESRSDREDGVLIRARLPERDVRRFAPFLVAGSPSRRATPAA
jgi:GTP-binding protein HflX